MGRGSEGKGYASSAGIVGYLSDCGLGSSTRPKSQSGLNPDDWRFGHRAKICLCLSSPRERTVQTIAVRDVSAQAIASPNCRIKTACFSPYVAATVSHVVQSPRSIAMIH